MARPESPEASTARWANLRLLQQHYKHFGLFMHDAMKYLGFQATWMQYDIAMYLQHGPKELMIQAQRGEAKSTITAIFALWCVMQDPKFRVLIVSGGKDQSKDVATMIHRLLMHWEILECMRPDSTMGDRTSVEGFDIHYSLKGIDKSASVSCVGIGSNLPGRRADLIIADDVETTKNAASALQREQLVTLCNEFPSICSRGRIVYLGTPQTSESIYNLLSGKGFAVRVWPGRYPTLAERDNYGDTLAPSIIERMEKDPSLCIGGGLLGDKGQPTDPVLLDEEALCKKELQGAGYFQLNFMLNTRLSDAQRFPLKTENLILIPQGDGVHFPETIIKGIGVGPDRSSGGKSYRFGYAHGVEQATMSKLQGVHMRVDPAGGGANGDETGYAVSGFLNGNIFLLAVGGVAGGYGPDAMNELAAVAAKFKPQTITVEKNMGHGAFTQVWLPILRKHHECAVEDDFVTGQKEKRIIGTLEPIMARGSLVILESVIDMDNETTEKYAGTGKRGVYSFFHQLTKIAAIKNCLAHDDRIDAVEGTLRFWLKYLAIDQHKKAQAEYSAKLAAMRADPLGKGRYYDVRPGLSQRANILNKYRR